MKIEYDPEVEETEEIKPGMIVDSDKSGNIPGIEVLNASKRGKLPVKDAA